eukprot:354792-Chlamydomonas_euryale.AAC.4
MGREEGEGGASRTFLSQFAASLSPSTTASATPSSPDVSHVPPRCVLSWRERTNSGSAPAHVPPSPRDSSSMLLSALPGPLSLPLPPPPPDMAGSRLRSLLGWNAGFAAAPLLPLLPLFPLAI